jgi:hypothetical protein
MDWLQTLAIAAVGAVVVIAIWFGNRPAVRQARTASDGHPNLVWWVSFGTAVVLIAYAANQLPDHLL